MRPYLIFIFMFAIFGLNAPFLICEEETKDEVPPAKKVSSQQVGGLLFDVDEGVEIEQGPGGSVYLKSNREFMKNKFEYIETRLNDLEARVQKLESEKAKNGSPQSEAKEAATPTGVLVS